MVEKAKDHRKANPQREGQSFQIGDWVVHNSYGIGQVQGIETKSIEGEGAAFHRIKTEDSVFWIPVEAEPNGRIRLVATPNKWKRILRTLRKPAKRMAESHQTRKKRIAEDTSDGSLTSTAKLIRDLWGRKLRKGGLSDTESSVLQRLTDRFIKEWSVCQRIPLADAQERLFQIFKEKEGDS
jgi:CarD family transcriptional regulator